MKHRLFIILFASIALIAEAQEKKQMTMEEKEETMQKLIGFYQKETMQHYNSQNTSEGFKVNELPWEIWANMYKDKKNDFAQFVKGFESMRLEADKDEPDLCVFMLCYPAKGKGRSYMSVSTGLGKDFLTDAAGNRTGFQQAGSAFYGLGVNIKFHLKSHSGKAIFIRPESYAEVERGNRDTPFGEREAYFALKFRLTVPYSEIASGYIDVQFFAPEQYESVTLTANDIGHEQTLCSVPFRLEKIGNNYFTISALSNNHNLFDKLKILYQRDGSIWDPNFVAIFGNLTNIMKLPMSNITFEEWLAQKRIDSNNLEDTLDNIFGNEKKPRFGKFFNTSTTGDTLLLYISTQPAEAKPVVTARLFAPDTDKPTIISVDQSQVSMLKNQLLHTTTLLLPPLLKGFSSVRMQKQPGSALH